MICQVGEEGELAIRGPQVMKGYWNRPDETSSVFRNGWLLTGDIAKVDGDGYFYIVDRKEDSSTPRDSKFGPRKLKRSCSHILISRKPQSSESKTNTEARQLRHS